MEGKLMGRRVLRGTAIATAATLAAIGALHVIWSVSPWPLADRESFARIVVGVPVDRLPSPGLTLGVAGLLFAAAYLMAAGAAPALRVGPRWIQVSGVHVVASVLLLRGVGGPVSDLVDRGELPADFVRFDLAVYSPLCLVLGTAAAMVARRGRRLTP
jgi:hypothetical protein